MAAEKITLEMTEKEYDALSVLLFAYKRNRHSGKLGLNTYVSSSTCLLHETDRALLRINKKING
jgi:hypothetical protein